MKKGFTLVELLALIVILAVILIIAVPHVLKTIEKSQEDSLRSTTGTIATSKYNEFMASLLNNLELTQIDEYTPCEESINFNNGTCEYALRINDDRVVFVDVRIEGSGKYSGLWAKGRNKEEVVVTRSQPADWNTLPPIPNP